MPIKLFPVEKQIKGGFNDGEIVENKPIQQSPDKTKLQPYSNIFYWAHAWANTTSTIGLHPHKAFEIMSFVLKGAIEHYDTKNKTWISLNAGDVQIIRAGNGISHAEKLIEGSHIFQIWLDPDISVSLSHPASYNDYTTNDFPVITHNELTITTYKGENAPIEMLTKGITIKQIQFPSGEHQLDLKGVEVHSVYLIEGELSIKGELIRPDDFLVISSESEFKFTSDAGGKIFVISSPADVPYPTYASSLA